MLTADTIRCCCRRLLPTVGLVLIGLGGSACQSSIEALLDEPRILSITADPPAVAPPGTVTATVRIYDPEFRAATIHWYLVFDPLFTESDLPQQDLSDPAAVEADDIFYLGSGTTVVGAIPELGDIDLPPENIFDTFPLSLLVSVDLGGVAFKGFKQVRVVVADLVGPVLERQLEREPTEAEIGEAVRVRLNHNPNIDGVSFAVIPDGEEFTNDMAGDLKLRREAPTRAVPVPSGFELDQGIRLTPLITDPDLADNPPPAEPGFNKLEVRMLSTEGAFYPLTLTALDWVPFEFSGGGPFGTPKRVAEEHGLVTVQMVAFDRQGGIDGIGLEVDGGGPPRPAHRGKAGSVLLAEGRRLQWLKLPDAGLFADLEVGNRVEVSATTSYEPRPPHGVVVRVDTVSTPTVVTPTTFLDRLDADPALRHTLDASTVTLRGTVVRRWAP